MPAVRDVGSHESRCLATYCALGVVDQRLPRAVATVQ